MRSLLLLNCLLLMVSTEGREWINFTEKMTESQPTKKNLQRVVVPNLTFSYFDGQDLTSLKISHSRIGQIDQFAFDNLKHLNLLDLSDNVIDGEIHPATFSRLPGLEFLVLKNIGLKRVRLHVTNVQELILAGNEIDNLGGWMIAGKNVNYLDVKGNKLTKLTDSFESLSKLSIIDISRNNISTIASNVFNANVNLIRILASENKINSTDGLKLPWLKTLDLFSNKLGALENDSFSKMAALEELVLAFNNIKRIEDPFKDLLELKSLDLAWNHIEEISPDLFRNNLYLNKLSLQGNRLVSLSPFTQVLHHLFHLDLSHNHISLFDDEYFASMPNLNVLDLSFNRLKTLTDLLEPLEELRVLNVAYNEIIVSGYELSMNNLLSRVNFSTNGLEIGLSLFRNNTLLTSLDLSNNEISQFCDADFGLKNLLKVSLKGNAINNLNCLKNKGFPVLCEVDVRNNPLMCGADLDDLILSLAMKKNSPYGFTKEFHSDLSLSQCETLSLNESVRLWNAVKHDLCPLGIDLQVDHNSKNGEWNSEEDSVSVSQEIYDEPDMSMDKAETEKTIEVTKKPQIFVPIGTINIGDFIGDKAQYPQSERQSWSNIDENIQVINNLNEEEEEEDAETIISVKRAHFSWYTIALILIALSFTLTILNLAVFMYIRLKVWKKADAAGSQRYTSLHNEVYKNTTEPSPTKDESGGKWYTENHKRNKLFSYGKINELLLNSGLGKKDPDSESVKILITSSNPDIANAKSRPDC